MRKLTHEEFLVRVKAKHGNTLTVLSVYADSRSPVRLKCNICGCKFDKKANPLLHPTMRQGCPQCGHAAKGQTYKVNDDQVLAYIESETNYRLVGRYAGFKEPTKFKCAECGRVSLLHPKTIYHNYKRRVGDACCAPVQSAVNSARTSGVRHEIKLNGSMLEVRGYEPQAIEYMKSKGVREDEIEARVDYIPRIPFEYQGKQRTHIPDIYVPGRRILVEVKSTYTMGLLNDKPLSVKQFETLVQKKRHAEQLGYKYNVLTMDRRGNRLKLPQRWYDMTHAEIRTWAKSAVRGA